jgi:hypothetical protein
MKMDQKGILLFERLTVVSIVHMLYVMREKEGKIVFSGG